MQYDLKANKFLSTYNTIEITEAVEPASMLLSSLSNMVYSLEKEKDASVSTLIKPLKEGKRLVDTTLEKGLGGSISILGTGGGLQTSPTVIQPQVTSLSTIMQKFDAWTNDVVERYHYRAAAMTVDNFDRLSTKNMIEFMNRCRDTVLLRPNVLWVLVGPKGMFSIMEEKAPRVSEVVTGQPIVISPLSLKEVHEAINVRMKTYALNSNPTLPVSTSVVDALYRVSDGELRFIFKRLSDIIYEIAGLFPSASAISDDAAYNVLNNIIAQRCSLSQDEIAFLRKIGANSTFRLREYKRFGYMSAQALNKRVQTLLEKHLLKQERVNKRNVLYKPTAEANILIHPLQSGN